MTLPMGQSGLAACSLRDSMIKKKDQKGVKYASLFPGATYKAGP